MPLKKKSYQCCNQSLSSRDCVRNLFLFLKYGSVNPATRLFSTPLDNRCSRCLFCLLSSRVCVSKTDEYPFLYAPVSARRCETCDCHIEMKMVNVRACSYDLPSFRRFWMSSSTLSSFSVNPCSKLTYKMVAESEVSFAEIFLRGDVIDVKV